MASNDLDSFVNANETDPRVWEDIFCGNEFGNRTFRIFLLFWLAIDVGTNVLVVD